MTPCANDSWVRRFIVSDPRKHSNGFTVYKVTSIVFPKGSPEAATKVVVWKRYNDFKKLHQELQQKHKKLYLSGKFPSFAEAKFFRRFEDDVIEERRKCATVLLEFIGAHPPLFTSNVFVKFFETGYTQDECKDLDLPEEKNNSIIPDTSTGTRDALYSACSNEPLQNKSENNGPLLTLGGTWQFPQVSDSISLSSRSSEEHTSYTDTDSALSGTSAVLQNEESQKTRKDVKNLDCSTVPKETWSPSTTGETLNSTADVPIPFTRDYMIQANHHITQALRHQAAGAYDAAFSLLKLGISCLLTGAQDETDAVRRRAVRSKTCEYLVAAEKLYNEHLAPRVPPQAQLTHTKQPTASPLSGLHTFKVLGVIGRVMLAMSTVEDQCYIVKVLYRSPCPVNKSHVPILPFKVPYMVKLHFYFETDSTVFLFLQHASGGRLWDHINSYLQSQPATPVHLLSQANVYLGRKLIQESPPTAANERSFVNDISITTHDDSYAALVQNYREGKLKQGVDVDGIQNETHCSDLQTYKNQKDTNNVTHSYESETKDVKSVLDVPVSDSSTLSAPSDNSEITPCVSGIDSGNAEFLETKELMRNAQQLLQSVSETLMKSSVDDDEKQNSITVAEPNISEECVPGKMKPRLKCLSLQQRSSGTKPSLERRLSGDDVFEWRHSASGGGTIHHWGKQIPCLPEIHVRQWAEQLVTCLAALHESGLVFRDLHPDNVLLAEGGHLLLSFTCCWPAVDAVVSREAVQNLYAAPEVTSIFEATPAVDWWSLGALMYELITGKPLHLSQPGGVHSHSILSFPDFVSTEAQSLLTELLRYHPQERLGAGVGGVEDIKSHPFFADTDWSAVHAAGLQT